jgi:hypothetical protein
MIEQIRLPFPGKTLSEQEDDILLTSLIFLKARNDIPQAKIGIGCVVRNRVNNPRWWGRNYRQVILSLADLPRLSNRETDAVLNPVKNGLNEKWDECYLVAKKILDNAIQDITYNSDYFFLTSDLIQKTPRQWYVCTIGNVQFYRVELKWNSGNPTKT